ncbi:MAG: hypothetical protein J5I98_33960, partial [Phaeodactylibacter sp.]|nr:hypothetical protein [Phaeodactylibacter sp.]
MKHFIRLLALSAFFLGLHLAAFAQENQEVQAAQISQEARESQEKSPDGPEKPEVDHSYKPLVLDLSGDGSKYLRFLFWHQHWVQTNNLANEGAALQLTHSIRRSRVMAYAQVSPR